MKEKKKKLVLPRELRLGDFVFLSGVNRIWLRQGDEYTEYLDRSVSEDEFHKEARLIAQTHKFDIEEIELSGTTIAYEFVLLEEEEGAIEADEVVVEETT